MKYAGLTDDPQRVKKEKNYPSDFKVRQFCSEADARRWEKHMKGQGYEFVPGGKGWRCGYTYSD
ncbi:MAG: hypothetical protein ACYS19_06845 [Planctomycetota bacterium]|jgi:hypothetical protein